MVMLGMFAGLLVGRLSSAELAQLAAVTVSPLVGLLGAVLGFYFGEQAGSRSR